MTVAVQYTAGGLLLTVDRCRDVPGGSLRGLQELSSEGAAALGKMKALQESLQREKERADGLDTKLKNAKVTERHKSLRFG